MDIHVQVSTDWTTTTCLKKLDSCNLECLVRDILMTLAIKRIHNLPPHLSYVSTLPDITQNRHTALTS